MRKAILALAMLAATMGPAMAFNMNDIQDNVMLAEASQHGKAWSECLVQSYWTIDRLAPNDPLGAADFAIMSCVEHEHAFRLFMARVAGPAVAAEIVPGLLQEGRTRFLETVMEATGARR